VPNVQDADGVAAHAIEDPKWIANDRYDAHMRTLRNAAVPIRVLRADALDRR
jgi:hypothetical protein